MRHPNLFLASLACAASALFVGACSNSTSSGPDASSPDGAAPDGTAADGAATDAAASDATAPDATTDSGAEAQAALDGAAPRDAEAGSPGNGEASVEGGGSAATFLAHFDPTRSELAEGLWEITDSGTPVVGFAPLATLVTVGADGGVQTFATLTDAAASNTFTLGIVSPGPNANVYVGVGTMIAADAGPEAGSIVPAPGVYRGSAAGGFALWSAAPSMRFPNGFDLVGNTLFVADSGGTIFRIDLTTSTATAWSTDPLLAPNVAACAGVVGLPIGANGIVHDANNFYVTNTDYGRIVKLPMAADGGSASVLVEDCTALAGADGVVLDTRDNSLLVAVNVQDKIVRVATTDGGTSVVTSGSPLDSPASVFIDSTDAGRRLLFTNAAFFSMPDAALPGLLELPIP